MPQHPNNIPIGAVPTTVNANTGTQLKTGAGVFLGVNAVVAGTTWVLSFYDNTSATGTPIAVVNTGSATGTFPSAPVKFSTGLYVSGAGTAGTARVMFF